MSQYRTADMPDRHRNGDGTGTSYMVIGTLLAAVAAYLFQLIVGRALGPTDFAPITVLWTIQFLVFTTVFIPMEQLTIRRLTMSTPHAAPWPAYLGLIGASVVASVLFSALTLDRLLDGEPAYLIIVAALVAAYGGFALGRGFLAGRRRYREYGLSTLAESAVRLGLAIVLVVLSAGALAMGWTLVAGALVVWLWRPFQGERGREAGASREQGTAGTLAAYIVGNAASQTIVAAGPLVVGGLGARPAEVSVFFETFLLFRAPLTVSYSLIARVMPPFTAMVERGAFDLIRRWALRIAAGGVLLAAAGYGVGLAIGADVVALMLGDEFRPTPQLAALAAAGVVLATVALFAQQLLIAMRATGRLAAAWLIGLVVAALVVWPDGASASIRVGRAFLAGESVAFLGLIAAVIRAR